MSLSSLNQVVTPELCCSVVYTMCNKIAACADFIQLKTPLPDTSITVYIRDKFFNVFTVDGETDSQGYAVINKDKYPLLLLNEYAGTFRIWAVYNGVYVLFADKKGKKYDAIDFSCQSISPKQSSAYIDISL